MFRVYIRQSDAPESLNNVCRQVSIPREIIPIVNAHMFWLTRHWAWLGSENERQAVTSAVTALMEALAYNECKQAGVPCGTGGTGGIGLIEDCECEEREIGMSCIKRVRIHNGRLQVSYFDEHSCADCWEDVGDVVLDSTDTSVGDELLDSENRAREGRKIRIRPPVNNINEEELARCTKATVLVDAAIASFEAAIGVKNGWIGIISKIIPVDILWEIAEAIIPVEIQAIFKAAEFVAASVGLSTAEAEEITTFVSGVVREELICRYVKLIKDSESIVGEDLTNLALTISRMDFAAAELLYRFVYAWDVSAFSNVLSRKIDNVDCGCPRIIAPELAAEPEDYDWCYVFDFTQDAFSTFWAVTMENGSAGAVWSEGVGYEDKIAAFQKTLSLHINNLTMQVVGADFYFKNERRGMLEGDPGNLQHYAGVGDTWNNSNQFFYAGLQVTDRAERIVQWRGFMNINNKVLTLRSILAYDSEGYETIPSNDTGNLILRSIKMWGKGTNPFGADNC